MVIGPYGLNLAWLYKISKIIYYSWRDYVCFDFEIDDSRFFRRMAGEIFHVWFSKVVSARADYS